jgi:hypothetical protein
MVPSRRMIYSRSEVDFTVSLVATYSLTLFSRLAFGAGSPLAYERPCAVMILSSCLSELLRRRSVSTAPPQSAKVDTARSCWWSCRMSTASSSSSRSYHCAAAGSCRSHVPICTAAAESSSDNAPGAPESEPASAARLTCGASDYHFAAPPSCFVPNSTINALFPESDSRSRP